MNDRRRDDADAFDRTRTAERRASRARPAHLVRLIAVHGPDRGAILILCNERRVIGREGHVSDGLELSDTEVSRRHAAIAPEGTTWIVEDLESRNGVYVNGAKTRRAPITHGGVIRVGGTVLLFDAREIAAGAAIDPESEGLPGPSVALGRVRAEIRSIAGSTVPVLITGESGTGKERVAEELHRQSGRRGPFVPINCAAIAPELAENELFGHVAGAFTGATGKSDGVFISADRGTLFLDEIGELPLALQPKLLRALAKGEVRPVGASDVRRVDVRVLAATNRDLDRAAREGAFRGDLLARLAGWTIEIPPLADRKDDVLALARRFLNTASHSGDLTADAAEALVAYNWPYNVRELEQAITSAAVRAGKATIDLIHLPKEIAKMIDNRSDSTPGELPLELFVPRDRPPTKDDLMMVLEYVEGSVASAAAFFGKDRKQIYRWAKRLGITPEAFRSEDAPADVDE